MSVKTTATTEVTLDTAQIIVSASQKVYEKSNSHYVVSTPNQEVSATSKEYSIVGDAFYAGLNAEIAPIWLTDLIDGVVQTAVDNGLIDYDSLVQDVRNAISAIDVSQNTYVEQINFNAMVDSIVGTHLATLNATNDGKFATITDMDIVRIEADSALVLKATDLQAEFSSDIDSRITAVETAFASTTEANASSILALATAFTDQESNLSGTSLAVTELQTHVGLDHSTSSPNGLGMLSRIDILEKQSDGVVDFITGTHDVMRGILDPNTDTTDDELIVDALPYVLWTGLVGSGVPIATTRVYTDYSVVIPVVDVINIIDGTVYVNSAFTDVNTDKYYKFISSVWVSITESDYLLYKESIRNAHTGDVYILYDDSSGSRVYVRSYKFIKTSADTTAPYYTDSDGYGWAIVTDTDTQSIYSVALEAKDIADGKLSHFYGWSDGVGNTSPTSYTIVTSETEYLVDDYGNYVNINGDITVTPAEYIVVAPEVVETIDATYVVYWFTNGTLYRKGTSWADKVPIPTFPGDGIFVAVGDLLTVLSPIDGDLSTYWFNGTSWQINGPSGVISKSKWYTDVNNAVSGPHGHVAKSLGSLKVAGETYANESSLKVEGKFSYNSKLIIDGIIYESGFGMDSTGSVQIGTDIPTGMPVFDSIFRVNAEKFVLSSPSYPGVEASFSVTASGISLGIEHTEATRNEYKGLHVQSDSYKKGDIVTSSGSSYAAIKDVPPNVVLANTQYWAVSASKGDKGDTVIGPSAPLKYTWVVYSDSNIDDAVSISTVRGTKVYTGVKYDQDTEVPDTTLHSSYNWYIATEVIDFSGNIVFAGTLDAGHIFTQYAEIGDGTTKVILDGSAGSTIPFKIVSNGSSVFSVSSTGVGYFAGGLKTGSVMQSMLDPALVLLLQGSVGSGTGGNDSIRLVLNGTTQTLSYAHIPTVATGSVSVSVALEAAGSGAFSYTVQLYQSTDGVVWGSPKVTWNVNSYGEYNAQELFMSKSYTANVASGSAYFKLVITKTGAYVYGECSLYIAQEIAGGGGITTIAQAVDTTITSPVDSQVLTFDATSSTWVNTTLNSDLTIDDTPVNGNTATGISSNWAFNNVKTQVPINALFTDTTYTNISQLVNDVGYITTFTDTNTWRPLGTTSDTAAYGNHTHSGYWVNGTALTCSSISVTSSISLKTIEYRESISNSLNFVVKIGEKGVAVGSYKNDNENKLHNFFIAEEVHKVDPISSNGKSVKTNDLLAHAYSAIAMLEKRIVKLESK